MQRKHLYKWQQERKAKVARRERIKRLQAELAAAQALLVPLELQQDSGDELRKLRAHIRTLEQRLRYISLP